MTGASNETILENLRRLYASEKPIWIRVPLVPRMDDAGRVQGPFPAP